MVDQALAEGLVTRFEAEEPSLCFIRGLTMKKYKLKKAFRGHKKGTQFFVVAESEFIGVREFVLRTADLADKLCISEDELKRYFFFLGSF